MAFLDTILPPPSLPACVSLAFETRAFASNRRETVRTNINYNPYLNPHPPKRAYPLCKRISLPSPSFSKVNTYIRNLPSPEFHRDEFRYASAFIRKIYLLPSILPKKRKRSSKRNEESRFFLSSKIERFVRWIIRTLLATSFSRPITREYCAEQMRRWASRLGGGGRSRGHSTR